MRIFDLSYIMTRVNAPTSAPGYQPMININPKNHSLGQDQALPDLRDELLAGVLEKTLGWNFRL